MRSTTCWRGNFSVWQVQSRVSPAGLRLPRQLRSISAQALNRAGQKALFPQHFYSCPRQVLCGYSKGRQLDTAPHTVPGEPTLANVPLQVAKTMQSMHSFASSPTLASSGMAALMPGWMHVLEVRWEGEHHGELEESHGAGGPQRSL